MQSKAKIQVFTDFDGTLSLEDTGVLLIDDERCLGPKKRRALEHAFIDGKMPYREAVWKLWDSVTLTWDEAWNEYLDKCSIDPGFPGFYDYCRESGFPVTIVSSGLDFLVRKLLEKYLGPKAAEIELVANKGTIKDRKWEIIYIDDTEYGNDKSLTLDKHRAQASDDTIFVFCGDGTSDISVAKHADVLFARNGKDLVNYCVQHNIPYIGFDSFNEVHQVVADLADRKLVLVKDEKTGFFKVVPALTS